MSEENLCLSLTFHIKSFECDLNRRWKPAAFFQHLTETAGQHAERLECGFDVMLSHNLYWVHSRMKIKFLRFPMDGEEITITTWPKTIQQKLFFVRDYEIHAANGGQLAAASSAWLVIDATARRMVPPMSTGLTLPCLPEKTALNEPLERLSVGDDGEERLRLTAGYSAIDMLGHVNNSRYVEWICDSFPLEMHHQKQMEWMQVNYDKEIRPGEEVAVNLHKPEGESGLWGVDGLNKTSGNRAFDALVKWKDM